MFLSWRITDDIAVEEFDKEYNGIYGYMKLQFGDYSIGYILDETVPIEGNSEILYYIKSLIRCGVALKNRENIEIRLLNYNLIKIIVSCVDVVDVKIVNVNNNSIEGSFSLSFKELVEEIKFNYIKLYKYIEEKNKSLLKAKMVKDIISLYNEFIGMLIF